MDYFAISLLHGLSYGLLLFMLTSGLTLVFSLMGVLNFAHASFYMLGAYLAYTLMPHLGFVPALIVAPLLVAGLGMAVERFLLRRAHRHGHVAELLLTFGLALLIEEGVKLIWGTASVSYQFPAALSVPLLRVGGTGFPVYKALIAAISLGIVLGLHLLVRRTRVGLVIRAALRNPGMVEALGHNVPRVFMLVFGLGAGLAGLAGVLGGAAFVTEPGMANAVGTIVFVVCVLGGMGSLPGAFLASLLIALIQTFAVGIDVSLADGFRALGVSLPDLPLAGMTLSQMAPFLPFLLMVLVLALRPAGLLGKASQ
ncbi:branched-chain amino acid ABC transporter permease [Acidimangrovimonas pyrenivorans]|uniref:Branched-chain amino acid ABC transporter permease n=1 Tax=Acidimangrovimonas pyrenivorans TaxID=2030798 RepID=A0ABV7ACK3_9RHOB